MILGAFLFRCDNAEHVPGIPNEFVDVLGALGTFEPATTITLTVNTGTILPKGWTEPEPGKHHCPWCSR